EIAEQDRAERAEAETNREPGPDEQQLQRLVARWEEGCPDQRGERAVDEEIVPLEHRARRAGGDHQADFLRARLVMRDGRGCCGGHVFGVPSVASPAWPRCDVLERASRAAVHGSMIAPCRPGNPRASASAAMPG